MQAILQIRVILGESPLSVSTTPQRGLLKPLSFSYDGTRRGALRKKKREKSLQSESSPLLSPSLALCICPSALSSSGMCLKETICWSICLLLCFLCHRLSPINDLFRTFPCPPSLVLPNRQPGQGGCAVFGWARGWYPLVSDSHREKRGLSDMHPICTHIPYTTNEGGAAAFYSVFIYSKVGIAVLTWVHKHTDFFLCFVVVVFSPCIADMKTTPFQIPEALGT